MTTTYLGSISGDPQQSIVNFLGPVLPRRAEKPSNGILEVPVTNYKREKYMSCITTFKCYQTITKHSKIA